MSADQPGLKRSAGGDDESAPDQFVQHAAQLVTNRLGVEVAGAGRWHLRYREHDHAMLLDRDAFVDVDGTYGSIIYLGLPLRWDPPYLHERIDQGKLEEIKYNLFEAFAAFGEPLEIYEYPR